MAKVFEGDIGTKITLDVGIDVSGATVKKMKYVKPDGTSGEWTAGQIEIINTTKFRFTTVATTDLDVTGKWQVNTYAEVAGWKGHGEEYLELIVYAVEEPSDLIVTVGGKTSNSYATIAEGNTYFYDRLNATDWTEASPSDKGKAMLQACRDVDSLKFIGRKYYLGLVGASNYQKLEFPRQYPVRGAYIDDVLEEYIDTAQASQRFPRSLNNAGNPYIPQLVKDAQCEQAINLLGQGSDALKRKDLQAQGVESFRLGAFSETYREGGVTAVLSPKATELLGDFIDTTFKVERS